MQNFDLLNLISSSCALISLHIVELSFWALARQTIGTCFASACELVEILPSSTVSPALIAEYEIA